MIRAAVLVLLASCHGQAATSCDVETQVSADLAGYNFIDCGRALDANADGGLSSAMQQGHDCVLTSISKNLSFRFLYADPQSGAIAGISGVQLGQSMTIRWYSAAAAPAKQLAVQNCQHGLASSPSCTPAAGVPCLECIAPVGAVLCAE
jgi:hypothetical protein